jgi:AcrR family transcriptional regulator
MEDVMTAKAATARSTASTSTASTSPAPTATSTKGRTPTADIVGALVDAAVELLEREGTSAVTVRAVAALAGVAPMGVYNHFGGKDGLVGAALSRGFDWLREAVIATDVVDPLDRLVAAGRRYREFGLAHPRMYDLMFADVCQDPAVMEAVEEHAKPAFYALVEVVQFAQAGGVVMDDDPIELAMRIWSAVHGAVDLELGDSVLTADPGVTYDRLLTMIVRGVAP